MSSSSCSKYSWFVLYITSCHETFANAIFPHLLSSSEVCKKFGKQHECQYVKNEKKNKWSKMWHEYLYNSTVMMLLSVSKETELILYATPYTNTLLTKLFRIDKHSLMNVKCIFKWLFYKRYCHSKFIFLSDFLYVKSTWWNQYKHNIFYYFFQNITYKWK